MGNPFDQFDAPTSRGTAAPENPFDAVDPPLRTKSSSANPFDEIDPPRAAGGLDSFIEAIRGRESGGNPNALSLQGALGSMQIMRDTFKQYALPGESFANDAHRTAAAIRKIQDDHQFYGGDLHKVAAAYIGGRGAVRSDGSIRDDVADAHGTTPRAYADQVIARMGGTVEPRRRYIPKAERQSDASLPDLSPEALTQRNPKRNAFAYANDMAINIANAAAGLGKAGVDLFAPGSAASEAIESFIRSGEDSQSDWQKAQNRKLESQLAKLKGDSLGQVMTYVQHAILEDPLKLISEAAGNIGPFALLGRTMAAARLGEQAATGISMSVAGALSAGEVRGNIYDKIQKIPDAELAANNPEYAALRETMSESAAKRQFGARFVEHLPELAVSAFTGALGGKYGLEGVAAGVGPRVGRLARGAISMGEEGFQGAVEQGATNVGARRVDPTQDLTEDVALNAVREGTLGIGGFASGGRRPAIQQAGAQPELEQLTQALASAPAALPTDAAPEEPPSVSDLNRRLVAAARPITDRAFLREMRDVPEFGPEAVSDLLHAFNTARNPSVDPLTRGRALDSLEQLIETFRTRPNFTIPPASPGAAPAADEAPSSALVPRRGETLPAAYRAPERGRVIEGDAQRFGGELEAQAENDSAAAPALPTPTPSRGTSATAIAASGLQGADFNRRTASVEPLGKQPGVSRPALPAPPASAPTETSPAASPIDEKAHEAASSPKNERRVPTDPQIEANNAKLGHVRIGGLDISIENPAGSERTNIKADGTTRNGAPPWRRTMQGAHYGYVRGTVGRDKDHVDVFIKEGTPENWSGTAFVIDQERPNGRYDEAKVILGAKDEREAIALYKAQYDKGHAHFRGVTPMSMDQLRSWLKYGDTKSRARGQDLSKLPAVPYRPRDKAPDETAPPKPQQADRRARERRISDEDSMFAAIAKAGGLSRDQVVRTWGADVADLRKIPHPVFGTPVVRVTGGRSIDDMAEQLVELGYLESRDLREFERKFMDELRGKPTFTPRGAELEQARTDEARARDAAEEADERALELTPSDLQTSGFYALEEAEREVVLAFVATLRGRYVGTEAAARVEEALERADEATRGQSIRAWWAAIQSEIQGVVDVEPALVEETDEALHRAAADERVPHPEGRAGPAEVVQREGEGSGAGATGARGRVDDEGPEYQLAPQTPEALRKKAERETDDEAARRQIADRERDAFQLVDDTPAVPKTAGRQVGLFSSENPDFGDRVEASRRPYADPRQLSLGLNRYLDRGPDPSQAGAAGEAAQRAAVSAVDDLHATETLLGLALSRDYAARQRATLVGQKVETAADLAVLAQVYRDPRFETFRIIFTTDNGRVVSQVGLTSRLPASSVAVVGKDGVKYLEGLARTATGQGATNFFMLHNHPSGLATPSHADLVLTRDFARFMPNLRFQGHVVIDTNEYAVINASGHHQTIKRQFPQPEPLSASEWAGFRIDSPSTAMTLAKSIEIDDGALTLIVLDAQHRVQNLVTVPRSVFVSPTDKLRAALRRVVLQTKGFRVVAVGRDTEALRGAMRYSLDAITVTEGGAALSLAELGMRGESLFPTESQRRVRLSPDTSPEFEYLRPLTMASRGDGAQRRLLQEEGKPPPRARSQDVTNESRPRAGIVASEVHQSIPEWIASGSPALKSATSKVQTFAPSKTMKEKVRGLTANWKERLVQGLVDAYAPLKRLDPKAYVLARMTKSADGALEGALLYGKPMLDKDGAIYGDLDGKGFLGAMQELNGEHDRFFMWVAGQRAARLYAEGRENLFSRPEIIEMQELDQGTMKDGSSRAKAYANAQKTLSEYNKAILDIAERTGLIDGQSRRIWEHEFYVPFFRVDEDMQISRPTKVKGLVRQEAFKRLKGGTENLGDLMANTLRNWSHLLSASLANQAAKASLEAAERVGVATTADAGARGATYFMDGGVEHWMLVSDPFVLDAISAMSAPDFKGLPMKLMGKAKKYLTIGVTVSPSFKIRNLIRDSIAAIGQNEMSFNPMANVYRGWKLTDRKSTDYAQMLFGGALMRFGTFTEGDRAEHAKRLIEAGIDDKTILDTPEKVKVWGQKLWDAWQDFGDRLENVNRTALYKQLRARGMSHLEASFRARDMMDFSLQGSFVGMRFLTQVVPFMNARAQGLYKMGRAAKENPARLAFVTGATALASIALLLAYADDDDWKARPDWDRDNYWWFKVGETAVRIPKPFEIGALGTLAERSVELVISDEMTGKRFAERMKSMLKDTFAMNPIPQAFKPAIDLYANEDSFTGRQIETRGVEKFSKPERSNPNTTLIAQMLGSAGNITGISPVQVDFLIRAYTGWLGTHIAMTVDQMAEPFRAVEKPARRVDDFFTVGDFVKTLPSNQSRYVDDFYKQLKAVQEVMSDLRAAREVGDLEKVERIMESKKDKLAVRQVYTHAEKQITALNKELRQATRGSLSAEEKRQLTDRLSQAKAKIAADAERRRLAIAN